MKNAVILKGEQTEQSATGNLTQLILTELISITSKCSQ